MLTHKQVIARKLQEIEEIEREFADWAEWLEYCDNFVLNSGKED